MVNKEIPLLMDQSQKGRKAISLPDLGVEKSQLLEDKYLRKPTSIRIDSKFRLCIADHMSYRLQVYQKDAIELDEHTIFSTMRNPSLTTA